MIKDINNGRWYGDNTPLPNGNGTIQASASIMRATLYELEAWGSN